MNKALIIFEGNWEHEQNLSTDVVPWSAITPSLGHSCPRCTANAYAVQGYLEAKNETNNFEAIRQPYYNSGLVFSIAGHGLGGCCNVDASVITVYHLWYSGADLTSISLLKIHFSLFPHLLLPRWHALSHRVCRL